MKDVIAVVAASVPQRGIGYKGQLPWKLPTDMAHFAALTSTPPAPGQQNVVVMGRTTYESIPRKFRPLPHRINVVLSTKTSAGFDDDNVVHATSWNHAWERIAGLPNVGRVFVIGGGQVYQHALEHNMCDKIVYTQVEAPETMQFDAFFPELVDWEEENAENVQWQTDEKSGLRFRIVTLRKAGALPRAAPAAPNDAAVAATMVVSPTTTNSDDDDDVNAEEQQYLDLCRHIIQNGVPRGDRTGTGTLSVFGAQMRFDLRNHTLPLLTTKRTFWRGVAEELLWFIAGNTNANDLTAKDIHIWDGNGSREFLDQRGLGHRAAGDLGPVYGFQWRHFGAKYVDMHHDYTGQGVDQLAACIDKIKHNPEDRRIVMSAWNPADLDEMALPPCHMFCQFYVDTTKNELSCQMYQRSADMGLGVPFNIASYALLTHLVAHVCGMQAGDFVHVLGDAHVYVNHVEALQEQLQRTPRAFPKLYINPDKTDVDDFVLEDLTVEGYVPHKTIKMKMAV